MTSFASRRLDSNWIFFAGGVLREGPREVSCSYFVPPGDHCGATAANSGGDDLLGRLRRGVA